MRDHEGRTIDFGRTAVDYERFRPGFPDSFLDRIFDDGWVRPGQSALDLGTGTGSLALGFARRGLDVIGIDISTELLEVANRQALDDGLSARFVEGRAERTSRESDSFDIVSAGQCWWWFDERAALAEARRVLRPGGRIILAAFSYLTLPGTVAGRTEDLILQHNPGWPKAGWRGVHPEQIEALDRAGFTDVESFSYVVDVPFTHEGWRGRMRTSNGVGSALSDDEVERFDAELTALLSNEFPGELSVAHRVFAVSGVIG